MGVMTHVADQSGICHDTLSDVTGRSGRGTARQTVRIDHELWDRFGVAARSSGVDRSSVLREFVRWYVHEAGLPERPAPATGTEDREG
jgi:hypothetical protein